DLIVTGVQTCALPICDPRVSAPSHERTAEARLMVPFQYNVRSLFVRKVTTIATAIGIAFVVFVFAGALMLRHGIAQALTASARQIGRASCRERVCEAG